MNTSITDNILEFHYSVMSDEHHRYLSWGHCYKYFRDHSKLTSEDLIDHGSLHLAFYLASWGMYRGSTFLLWKDYKIHRYVVNEILNPKYSCFWDLDLDSLSDAGPEIQLLFSLADAIKKIYRDHIKTVDSIPKQIDVSDTLVTKILLGTMACTPAYDRYVIAGLGKRGFKHRRFTQASYRELLNFYRMNSNTFSGLRLPIPNSNFCYPPMKLIDMYFWSIGSNSRPDK